MSTNTANTAAPNTGNSAVRWAGGAAAGARPCGGM